jgi:hypothetical protein
MVKMTFLVLWVVDMSVDIFSVKCSASVFKPEDYSVPSEI